MSDAAAARPLFNPEQLESHALALAAAHRLAAEPRRARPLLPRLDESAAQLEEAYQFLSTIARTDPSPVASEDWLRDNYHVVQDQVREVRQDLPRKFYLQLPKLGSPKPGEGGPAGPYEGFPRVYLIARELIAHTAGRFDLENSDRLRHRVPARGPALLCADGFPDARSLSAFNRGAVARIGDSRAGVTRGVKLVEVDGVRIEGDVPMVGVEGSHTVRVVLG